MTGNNTFTTKTGERVRISGRTAEIGLSDEAQRSLGDALHVNVLPKGSRLEAGDAFGVVEGVRTAGEFYTPVAGVIRRVAGPDAMISDWLVTIEIDA
tara:strand:+ start:517 stop:807 length:291 start_codon:yes stop_codon:yes gene_type:complete